MNSKTNSTNNITSTHCKTITRSTANENALSSSSSPENNVVIQKLKYAIVLCTSFLLIEIFGGIYSHSLAVLSDAAHLFADLASFVIALLASEMAHLPADSRRTFGWRRIEALAALFSVFSLSLVTCLLALEALVRLYALYLHDTEAAVDGRVMSGIALIGVLVNLALAAVLGEHHHIGHSHGASGHDHSHSHDHSAEGNIINESTSLLTPGSSSVKIESYINIHDHDHDHDHSSSKCSHNPKSPFESILHCDEVPHDDTNNDIPSAEQKEENINLRAAYLHVLGDLGMSIAVLMSGILIWQHPEWQIADPLCTLFFSVVVARSTISPFQQSMSILMNETPPHIDYQLVLSKFSSLCGVSNVHDLHIWSISQGVYSLSVHLNVDISIASLEDVLTCANNLCRREFGIDHLTVQVSPIGVVDDSRSSATPNCITCDDDTAGFSHPN